MGLLYEKDVGARRNFWKYRFTGTQILFCGCGLNCFSLQEATIWKQHISCHIYFRLITLKDTAIASAMHLLMLNTLRDAKTDGVQSHL